MNYTLIIPFYNEEENLKDLLFKIERSLEKLKNESRLFQVILIDDGSTDNTFEKLKEFGSKKISTLILKHKNNYSQSAAILTGIINSKFENIITLDGDGQNDPEDIEKLIIEYEKNVDMVIGWRKDRKDSFLVKNLPSYVANFFVRMFSKSKIHDHGCALKIFKKDKMDDLTNWGDFHRLLAARFSYNGYSVKEVVVKHHKRQFGKSNYGFNRVIYVILDIIYLKFFKNYRTQSIYFFGFFSFLSFILSLLSFSYMIYLKVAHGTSFILTPLPLLTIFLFMISLIILFIGFLAQLIINQAKTEQNLQKNVTEKIEIS